jgi:hypothetical protein
MRNVFRKSKWGELSKDIQLLISRIPALLLVGTPKTWSEVIKYFADFGPRKGLVMLAKHLWWATHVGLPLMMSTYHTIQNLYFLKFSVSSGEEKNKVKKDYMDNLEKDMLSQYKGYPLGFGNDDDVNVATIAWGLLAPGHYFLYDVMKMFEGRLDKIERGEDRPKNTPPELMRVFVKNKITKPVQDGLYDAMNSKTMKEAETAITGIIDSTKNTVNNIVDKGKEKATEVVDKIGDTEPGFKLWCKNQKPPLDYVSFIEGIGTTSDNRKWEWKESLNTFGPWGN